MNWKVAEELLLRLRHRHTGRSRKGRKRMIDVAQPERFSWEERDGVADSFARRGESEARADCRPMVETQIERTTKLLRRKTQPAQPIQLNRSG
jgi:hypothetical protein